MRRDGRHSNKVVVVPQMESMNSFKEKQPRRHRYGWADEYKSENNDDSQGRVRLYAD